MNGDWYGTLNEADRAAWDDFERHTREHTIRAMDGSAMVMSLVPSGEPDVKFAVELGLAIMMGKPIIALALPGRAIPEGLRKVAAEVVVADVDTEAGQARIREALNRLKPGRAR